MFAYKMTMVMYLHDADVFNIFFLVCYFWYLVASN